MRLIDADALISDLEYDIKIDEDSLLDYEDLTDINRKNIQNDKDCKQSAVYILKSTPSVDAVPVVHGHWKYRRVEDAPIFFNDRFYCSACENWNTHGKSKYCPHCGARMDGEVE